MEMKFNKKYFFIGLNLKNDDTGKGIEDMALKEGFRKKDKRHITILYHSTSEIFKNIQNGLSVGEKARIIKEIKNLLKNFKWEFKPTEIYKIEKKGHFSDPSVFEHRESYINLVYMPEIDIFYKNLNSLLKSDFPVQFPHITLFTKGERRDASFYGIPVPSAEEFHRLNPRKIN